MKVVIVEDEIPAAEKLRQMLLELPFPIEIAKELTSLKESLPWFQNNPLPDLVFMDIELSDGLSFELIEKAAIGCPIVFITAFDEYWQEAFEHNSVDYLLKPLKKERLQTALEKFDDLKKYFTSRYHDLLVYKSAENIFKDRFLVRRGKDLTSIKTEDIAFFYATHKLVCLVDKNAGRYILDTSLSELEKQLKPELFFRANRKYLLHKNAVDRITVLPKSKLSIEITPAPPDKLIVSSENSSAFKKWMAS
ncbi:MAG: LytR/AlgR family response regulator transcription factor [Flavisolibacter sp.]|jgi:DNA-binding LytR/AlgR family response regulator